MEILVVVLVFSALFIGFLFMYIKNLVAELRNKDIYIQNIYEYSVYYKDIVYRFQNRNIVLDESAIQALLVETKDFVEFLSNIEKTTNDHKEDKKDE